MNNIYTVVPCRTYKVTATEACTLTDGHGLTLELTPGEVQTFEAKTSELHTSLPIVLQAVLGAAGGGAPLQPETREECNWVLIWRKGAMGVPDSQTFTGVDNWSSITSNINNFGGICLPLGDYAILVKRPAGWAWDSQDALFNIFNPFQDMVGLESTLQYYYFNLLGIES